MLKRTLLSFLASLSIMGAQTPARNAAEIPEAELEAAHQANPDDAQITLRLLNYYAMENRDASWSARFAVLSWGAEHHPDAPYFFATSGMPKPLREQIKQLFITQVRQHPDNPRVLRNAASVMEEGPSQIRVGGNVQSANLQRQVKPEYPQEARDAGIQGTVRFNVTINKEGDVQALQLVSGHPLLVTNAMNAVKQWKYKPTLLNGNPVDVVTSIDVNFTLNN